MELTDEIDLSLDEDDADAEPESTTAETTAEDGERSATEERDASEEDAKPANRWERMRDALSKVGEGAKIRLPGEPADDASEEDDAAGEGEGEGEAKGETPREGEHQPPPKPEGNAPAKPAAGKPAYTITDAEGDELELEWPEGARVTFKGDGREINAGSFDELVTLAQKGVAFDRRSSEWGQERSQLVRQMGAQAKTVEGLQQEIKTAEEILLRAVFDKEARQELRRQLKPYRDPAVREGLAAKQELQARDERDSASREQQQQQVATQFWTRAAEEAKKAIDAHDENGVRTHQFVAEDDVPQILDTYYHNYEQYREALLTRYRGEAAANGITEAEAEQIAEQVALEYLTEENLRAVVTAYEEHYRTRAGKAGQGSTTPTPSKPAGTRAPTGAETARAAEEHNRRVTRKLEQRARPRPLRGGGAPPAGAGSAEIPSEGLTFRQRMELMRRELHKAGR